MHETIYRKAKASSFDEKYSDSQCSDQLHMTQTENYYNSNNHAN